MTAFNNRNALSYSNFPAEILSLLKILFNLEGIRRQQVWVTACHGLPTLPLYLVALGL